MMYKALCQAPMGKTGKADKSPFDFKQFVPNCLRGYARAKDATPPLSSHTLPPASATHLRVCRSLQQNRERARVSMCLVTFVAKCLAHQVNQFN